METLINKSKLTEHLKLGLITILIMFFSLSILTADILSTPRTKATYTGQTVAAGAWADADNWSKTSAPDPTSDKCNLTINHDITYNPGANPWSWGNNIDIIIKTGATLTINADLNIATNFDFTIEPGGQLIINGNLYFANNVNGNIDGEMYVDGDLEVDGGGSSDIGGTGDIVVEGEITDNNGALDEEVISDIERWLIVDNGDWGTNTSWSKTQGGDAAVSAPNDQCIVHIENTYTATISDNVEITELDVQTGGKLVIDPGKTLTVSTAVTNNGSIEINSDATGTGGLIYNGAENIQATVERYITAYEFHYVSTPLSSAPVSSYNVTSGGYNNPNFYSFNEAEANADWAYGWTQESSGNLIPGKGYAVYTDENYAYSLTGGYLQNTEYDVAITNTSSAGGSKSWNLIGNPFPCNIDADDFIDFNDDGTVFTGSLYFWDDDASSGTGYGTADYIVYTKGGATSGGNGTVHNGIITPMQAFFVQAVDGGNLSFPVNSKTTSAATFTKSAQNAKVSELQMIRLSVTSEKGLYNDILLKFADDADEGIDIYDGRKLKGNSNIAFYSLLEDEEYAIQGFPEITDELKIELGLDANVDGNYTIKAEDFINLGEDIELYLEDKELDIITDLKESDYNFFASGVLIDRFVILFSKSTGIEKENLNSETDLNIYSYGSDIHINDLSENSVMEVYDITGKMLTSKYVRAGNNTVSTDLTKGYYIVRISNTNKVMSKKIFIK